MPIGIHLKKTKYELLVSKICAGVVVLARVYPRILDDLKNILVETYSTFLAFAGARLMAPPYVRMIAAA